jgi:hypothetical protein
MRFTTCRANRTFRGNASSTPRVKWRSVHTRKTRAGSATSSRRKAWSSTCEGELYRATSGSRGKASSRRDRRVLLRHGCGSGCTCRAGPAVADPDPVTGRHPEGYADLADGTDRADRLSRGRVAPALTGREEGNGLKGRWRPGRPFPLSSLLGERASRSWSDPPDPSHPPDPHPPPDHPALPDRCPPACCSAPLVVHCREQDLPLPQLDRLRAEAKDRSVISYQ